jgi:hypothetical protein
VVAVPTCKKLYRDASLSNCPNSKFPIPHISENVVGGTGGTFVAFIKILLIIV